MQVAVIQATITRPANTTAYVAGQVVGTPQLFQPTGYGFSLGGQVKAGVVTTQNNAGTKPDLELWLFSANPTSVTADAVSFAPTAAEMKSLIAIIAFPVASFKVANAGAGGAGSAACAMLGFDIPVTSTVYGVLVVRNAYAPVSGEVLNVNLNILKDYVS